MAVAHDPNLHESLELKHDPVLTDPTSVPWTAVGLTMVALLAVLLVVLRLRHPKPVPAVAVTPEPVEDTLAALEGVWQQATPDNVPESVTALAAILRRYLSRTLTVDCTTSTTAELDSLFISRAADDQARCELCELRSAFFDLADRVRFAGLPATIMTVHGLYETARDFVVAGEQARVVPPESSGSAPAPPAESVQMSAVSL